MKASLETSYVNKPYFFVPLIKKAERHGAMNRQDLLSGHTGILHIGISCVTPLHFGSGCLSFDEAKGSFLQTLLRENGKPALPGSSFKGMLRSVFEALTESCLLIAPKGLEARRENLSVCEKKSYLCPACSVFGRMLYKGKLMISSFATGAEPIILNIPSLKQPFITYPETKPDPHTGNERLYYGDFKEIHGLDVARMSKADFLAKKKQEQESGGDFYGRKFYKHSANWNKPEVRADDYVSYECLPPEAVLEGRIIYQGLTEDELGGLLFALGLGWGKPIYHKLGYAKPAFLGSIKLSVRPLPLPRYGSLIQTAEDGEKLAADYYERHKAAIGEAVRAFEQEWTEIGSAMWVRRDDKYGY